MKGFLAGFISVVLSLSVKSDDRDPGMTSFEQQDYASALSNWAIHAATGNPDAQFNLGYLYENGFGTTKSLNTAKFWYSQSALQGSAVAQHHLATLHHDSEQYVAAVNWYTRSAEQGFAEAQADLGASYGLGQGVPQSYVYALMWSYISSLNGFDKGTRLTAGLVEVMSPREISIAQYLARDCIEENFKGCNTLPAYPTLLAMSHGL